MANLLKNVLCGLTLIYVGDTVITTMIRHKKLNAVIKQMNKLD